MTILVIIDININWYMNIIQLDFIINNRLVNIWNLLNNNIIKSVSLSSFQNLF